MQNKHLGLNQAKLEDLIRGLRPCRAAVVGDVMLDRYVLGVTDRISPEAPIPILEIAEEFERLGGAANVTTKVVELGSSAATVGLVGVDSPAAELRALLASQPSNTDRLVADPGRATTVKTRFISLNQQLLRADREHRRPPTGEILNELARATIAASAEADTVILVDYGKGVLCPEVVAAAIGSARARGASVVVDPNGSDYSRYIGATVLTPNLKEAEVASQRRITDLHSLEEAAHVLIEQSGAAIAVTRGSDGISLFQQRFRGGDIEHTHFPTSPITVHDVTGAGDAVTTIIALALASGIDMPDACILANLAGRSVVAQLGVGSISIAQILDETSQLSFAPERKVVSVAEACQTARKLREAGRNIVFTNGCFDVLHQGHASLLQFARAHGDFLVVGLNSDGSVKRYKGVNRPYVIEAQRAYMLSLYSFVDLIVIFDDDTPLNLIQAIRPDVLVKGDDYTTETIVGRDLVESYGGRVHICPRLAGLSTTALMQRAGH
jgi:D-beta-D-heptose 7-phosphate kinase / D-beta-D-heptose 1-phosphate adenosyltransferase